MAYSVRISGTVLSSLLYECANAESDIEGFLLGVLSFETTIDNDDTSEQAIEKRQDFIIVHAYQVLKTTKPYDSQGNLIKSVISSEQKDPSSLVGYFKFRRQTDTSLSIRDQVWMTSWSSNIPHGCMAIITAHLNSPTDKSTLTYEFGFWDMRDSENKLPLIVTNMKESAAGYKAFMSNAPYQTPSFSSNTTLVGISPSETILEQYNAMYQKSFEALEASTQKVVDKEREIERLKQEIESIQSGKD